MKRTCLSILLILLLPQIGLAQSIVTNGTTNTSVSADTNNRPVVRIAPPKAGVSVNGFKDFNVPQIGATLDNRTASASVIVNEVTGSTRSQLSGPLVVDGARADIIIANPNGITVNGGSFVNTGAVALATGKLSTDPASVLRLLVDGGDINVTGAGLVAEISQLDLLTSELRVDAPIDMPGASIVNATIGSSETLITEAGLALPLRRASDVQVVAELSPASVLHAGSVRIVATGAGPGVRLSGDIGVADQFSVTADGLLRVKDAQIVADHAFLRSLNGQAELEGVDLRTAGSLSVRGTGAEIRASNLESTQGGVLVRADDGNVSIDSSVLAGAERSGSFVSVGAVTVRADGDVDITSHQSRTRLVGQAANPSRDSGDFDVAIFATASVTIEDTEIESTGGVRLEVDDGFHLLDTDIATERGFFVLTKAFDRFDQPSLASFTNGSVVSNGELRLNAGELKFKAEEGFAQRIQASEANAEFVARAGSITFAGVSVDIRQNSTLQDALPALRLNAKKNVVLKSLDEARITEFLVDGDVEFIAEGDIANYSGALIASGDIFLTADDDFHNETSAAKSSGIGKLQLKSQTTSSRKWWTLFTRKETTEIYEAGLGELVAGDRRGFISSSNGAVAVTAENISNRGADISGLDITLAARKGFSNDAMLAGHLSLKRECTIWCSSSGSSDVFKLDGRLVASENLTVTAGKNLSSEGGVFFGGEEIALSGETIKLKDLPTPLLIRRPGTLGSFFGAAYWIYPSVEGPVRIISPFGNLNVAALGSVELVGVDFTVGGEISLPEHTQESELEERAPVARDEGGIFDGPLDR